MDERVQAAFAQVRAEDALKARTLSYLAQATGGWGAAAAPRQRRKSLAAAAACAACLLMALGSLWLYFTPAAYISVDVNPSVELTVNRFDRVIALTGRNADGTALARSLDVRFLDYTQALEQVLDSGAIADCLDRGETLSITVAGDGEARTAEILTQVTACAESRGSASCHAADLQTAQAAHDHGLSCGKYRMLLELQALDPEITADDVRERTMGQLRQWLAELEDSPANAPPVREETAESRPGASGGHGHGRHER